MALRALVVACLFAAAWASPTKRAMSVHERTATPPSGFKRLGAAHPDAPLTLRLALKQSDTDGLIQNLMRVSDPKSPDWTKHLSKAEVESFMRPKDESLAAVNSFLSENGITAHSVSPAGDWLEFTIPVSKANDLFDAEFSLFQHSAGSRGVRTLAYSLPIDLREHVSTLFPGVSFWVPSRLPKFEVIQDNPLSKRQNVPAGCDTQITPACLQALYGIPTTPATQASNGIGVSGFIQQFANRDDLRTFLRNTRPDIRNGTFADQSVDGGQNPQFFLFAGIEADLDTQYTVGVATNVPVTFISVGENTQDGDLSGFLDIINALLAEDAPPQVLTTSFGANEGDISPALAQTLCTAYAALGARGTSIFFASGDGGVAGAQQSDSCTTFVPTFPSGCPFITTVGATENIPETAADFSSGGFSNVFPAADFQADAVAAYLAQIEDLNAGLFNRTGRGIPDISAMGNNVLVFNIQLPVLVGGTSCSSPISASIIGLINDRRIAAGMNSLGFLNPFLYANPQAFTDITTGSNPGCNTNGFPALTGWDPVTGLGTPIFDALAAAAGV